MKDGVVWNLHNNSKYPTLKKAVTENEGYVKSQQVRDLQRLCQHIMCQWVTSCQWVVGRRSQYQWLEYRYLWYFQSLQHHKHLQILKLNVKEISGTIKEDVIPPNVPNIVPHKWTHKNERVFWHYFDNAVDAIGTIKKQIIINFNSEDIFDVIKTNNGFQCIPYHCNNTGSVSVENVFNCYEGRLIVN